MYYIKMLLASMVLTLGINSVTYVDFGGSSEKKESSKSIAQEEAETPSTERFLVVSDLGEGYVDAYSLEDTTNAPNGYLLDATYKVGDVVEVTYLNDDIIEERLLNEEEISKIFRK